jgi:hypothetical protein
MVGIIKFLYHKMPVAFCMVGIIKFLYHKNTRKYGFTNQYHYDYIHS